MKLSITEGGKEGKSKEITYCRHLEERFQECSKKEGVIMATSVETVRSGLRNANQAVGSEGEGKKEKV